MPFPIATGTYRIVPYDTIMALVMKTMERMTTLMYPQQETTKPTSKATAMTLLSAASSLKVRMVTATSRVLRALL
jgi:protein involved in temperature-dependent protein secretion